MSAVMKKRGERTIVLVGSAATSPDVHYSTGFHATDNVVMASNAAGRYLVVPGMEAERARRQGRVAEVFTPKSLGLSGKRRMDIAWWTIALLRRLKTTRVIVPPAFPLRVARKLEQTGIGVALSRAPLFPERQVKRLDEIAGIKEAQQAAVIAMRAAVEAISGAGIGADGRLYANRRALTSEDVRKLINEVLVRHSCVCKEAIVSCGAAAADPHERGKGPLLANEPIVIDIFPQHFEHGYWGDITRTVVRGSAPERIKSMYAAVKAAQEAALRAIRPGARCSTVHKRAQDELARHGFRTELVNGKLRGFIHGTGHGVGLSVHESPSLAPGTDARLRKGNVVTVEPGLYYPGEAGLRIEDLVMVTSDGWRYMVPCEKKLVV